MELLMSRISNDMLWNTLMAHFTLPEDVDPLNIVIERKVRAWDLKKMAA
jgi:hypothetical protein